LLRDVRIAHYQARGEIRIAISEIDTLGRAVMGSEMEEHTDFDSMASTKQVLQYLLSAFVASSLCLLVYNPDLAFLGCLLIAFYIALFVIHAYCIRSYTINTLVVLLFWALPFAWEILYRYNKFGNWRQTFEHLSLSYAIIKPAIVAIHIGLQSGLVFLFRTLGKSRRIDEGA
jgi:hypothetical protein